MPPNHNYNTPAEGASDWHHPLNSNFEQLDTDVEIRDAESNRSDYEPKDGAKFLATDTGAVYLGDGAEWARLPRPDSGGTDERGSDHVVSAAEFDGDGLASRIRAAFDYLVETADGQGRIHVGPAPDGDAWTWDRDLTFEFAGMDVGLHLDIDDTVHINYPGDGTALTLVASDASGINVASRSKIVGGRWESMGDADAWLQVDDAFRTHIDPSEVRRFDTGIRLRNVEQWTESSHISGSYKDVRVGIAFQSNAVVGSGGGTDSFHDTTLESVQISAREACLVLSGRFMYSHVDNATLQPTESGATCLRLQAPRMDGTVFTATKFESPANPGNVAAVEYGDAFDAWYGPLFVNPLIGYGIDTDVAGDGTPIPSLRTYGNALWVEGLGGEGTPLHLNIATGAVQFGHDGAEIRLSGGDLVAVDSDGNETQLT